jgi:hypothetical protein
MRTYATSFCIMLGLLYQASTLCADKKETKLLEGLNIKKITFAAVINSPKGFSNKDGRRVAFISDVKALDSLAKHLSMFPLKSGTFKKWPKNIPHWMIYLHTRSGKVVSLDIYGESLRSPLDRSILGRNPDFMKLLKAALRPSKAPPPQSRVYLEDQAFRAYLKSVKEWRLSNPHGLIYNGGRELFKSGQYLTTAQMEMAKSYMKPKSNGQLRYTFMDLSGKRGHWWAYLLVEKATGKIIKYDAMGATFPQK